MPETMIETDTATGAVRTYFAPAERANEAELKEAVRLVKENPLFEVLQNSIDGYLMILNPQRQVLAVNEQLLKLLGLETSECFLGWRPGEVISCIHSKEGPGGCGTSPACAQCGAVISILTSQIERRPAEGECLATVRKGGYGEALEFRVRATPVTTGGHDFTVLIFNDISGDKRRQALERVFYHDIMNTVSGLLGLSALLVEVKGLDPREIAGRIVALSKKQTREIQDQRKLNLAENGTLEVETAPTLVAQVLNDLRPNFEALDVAKGKELVIEEASIEDVITTDASLLGRILTNMTKNAMEAVKPGATVRVLYERRDGDAVFSVHNPGQIPDKVALQIFQRSFSTKSRAGRGLGTYSMKLFGEKCLGGKVAFETSESGGTVFSISLSLDGPPVRH